MGVVVVVTNFVARGLSQYEDCVGWLVSVYKINRVGSPFCVFSVAFNAITPEAQDTLWKLQHKAYAAMPYIMELAVAGQLLLVKSCQLNPVETDVLSDIDYVLPERTQAPKRKRASGALPRAKRSWASDAVDTIASWQLGTLASSAQLAGAAAADAGAAGGAARAAGMFIDLTEDEPPAVLEAHQAAVARLALLRENEKLAVQPLRVQEDKRSRPPSHARPSSGRTRRGWQTDRCGRGRSNQSRQPYVRRGKLGGRC